MEPMNWLVSTTGSFKRVCSGSVSLRALANQAAAAKIDKWAQASVPVPAEVGDL